LVKQPTDAIVLLEDSSGVLAPNRKWWEYMGGYPECS